MCIIMTAWSARSFNLTSFTNVENTHYSMGLGNVTGGLDDCVERVVILSGQSYQHGG